MGEEVGGWHHGLDGLHELMNELQHPPESESRSSECRSLAPRKRLTVFWSMFVG